MTIRKQYVQKKGICKVTFAVSETEGAEPLKVHVVGDFNNWSTTATPMKRSPKGVFSVSMDLEKGREYQFRYLFDDQRWDNEAEADKLADSPYTDARNSVIVT